MIRWLIDRYRCWRYGHVIQEWSIYRYCIRCGHLEVKG